MGLDQYAWAIKDRPEKDFDFELDVIDRSLAYPACFRDDPVFYHLWVTTEGNEALAYWRKHPNLHGAIQEIYARKGGDQFQWGSFVGPVILDLEDIEEIEKRTREGTLPPTSGFFFGISDPSDDPKTLEFCKRAKDAIARGLTVVYDSSW